MFVMLKESSYSVTRLVGPTKDTFVTSSVVTSSTLKQRGTSHVTKDSESSTSGDSIVTTTSLLSSTHKVS